MGKKREFPAGLIAIFACNPIIVVFMKKIFSLMLVLLLSLTAVFAAALTIYDMCKAVQKDMHIEGIKLLKKTGGKSGDYIAKD